MIVSIPNLISRHTDRDKTFIPAYFKLCVWSMYRQTWRRCFISYFTHFKKFEKDMAELEIELEEVKASATEGKKDQEDLLILLAEHESKLKTYRDRLKELGEKVMKWYCINFVTVHSVILTLYIWHLTKYLLVFLHIPDQNLFKSTLLNNFGSVSSIKKYPLTLHSSCFNSHWKKMIVQLHADVWEEDLQLPKDIINIFVVFSLWIMW